MTNQPGNPGNPNNRNSRRKRGNRNKRSNAANPTSTNNVNNHNPSNGRKSGNHNNRQNNRNPGSYEYYGRFPPSMPRKAIDGIKSKNTRGDFGETWWAKRWIAVLESYGLGNRLQRGRTYARQGQVLDIDIGQGSVIAKVQGSRPAPYTVKINLPVLSDAEWERAIDAMSAQAIFAAKLLAGEMPDDIENAFKAANIPLFPAKARELVTHCSCPDVANPCKHIAAVYYLLGEQFDVDPFLIFTLRGRTREQIIEALRKRRAAAVQSVTEAEAPQQIPQSVPSLADQIESFWQTGDLDSISIHVARPEIQVAVLRRLGPPPAGTLDQVALIYTAMSEYAMLKTFGE